MTIARKLRKAGETATAAEAEIGQAIAPADGTALEKIVTRVGEMGDQPELRTVCAFAVAAGLLTSNRRLVRAGVRMLLAHEIATLAKSVIKRRVNRTRPRAANSQAQRKVKLGRETAKEETSFPSGHSAGASAVARGFAREFPQHQGAALAAAALVAGAQIPRLAHYPTDVAGGVLIGLASEAVADLIVGPRHSEDPAKREAPPRPPLHA